MIQLAGIGRRTAASLLRALVLLLLATPGFTDDFKGFDLVALSAADDRAVVRQPDGQMAVVKTGDVIPGSDKVVKQILMDKLLLADQQGDGKSGPAKSYFLHRAAPGAHSRLDPIEMTPPPVKDLTPRHPNDANDRVRPIVPVDKAKGGNNKPPPKAKATSGKAKSAPKKTPAKP